MKYKLFLSFLILAAAGLIVVSCRGGLKAQAKLTGTSLMPGLHGTVDFTEKDGMMHVHIRVKNASEGDHAIHIHEGTSCDNDGMAAGGHFNPDDVKHGYLPEDGFGHAHAGDFGNLTIGAGGSGEKELVLEDLTLLPGHYNIANRAVILHAGPDRFVQPTGDAGGRIACGLIREK